MSWDLSTTNIADIAFIIKDRRVYLHKWIRLCGGSDARQKGNMESKIDTDRNSVC